PLPLSTAAIVNAFELILLIGIVATIAFQDRIATRPASDLTESHPDTPTATLTSSDKPRGGRMKTIIRTRRKAAVIAAATGLALTMTLSGCGLLPGGREIPDDLVLHPSGNEDAWILNEYAQGVGGEWV